jgi:nitroimidazol reductase NimA-like FMN-containing flavoprotein (pyridoxamine 5'-phosphate oxidase superfamily)
MSTPQDPGSGLIATLEPLSRPECYNRLATAAYGRLGFVVDEKPVVLPVNYAIDGETILFRTAPDSILNAASLSVVAFEVDRIDESTHTGWSVLVQGFARDVGDVGGTSERIHQLSLITWAPGERVRWLRIDPESVTGRQLRVMPAAL